MTPIKTFHDAVTQDRTHEEWADILGISRSHFTMIFNGTARPSDKLKVRIQNATAGAISPASWFDAAVTVQPLPSKSPAKAAS